MCAAAARLLAKHTDTHTRGGKVIWPLTDKAQLLPLPAAPAIKWCLYADKRISSPPNRYGSNQRTQEKEKEDACCWLRSKEHQHKIKTKQKRDSEFFCFPLLQLKKKKRQTKTFNLLCWWFQQDCLFFSFCDSPVSSRGSFFLIDTPEKPFFFFPSRILLFWLSTSCVSQTCRGIIHANTLCYASGMQMRTTTATLQLF